MNIKILVQTLIGFIPVAILTYVCISVAIRVGAYELGKKKTSRTFYIFGETKTGRTWNYEGFVKHLQEQERVNRQL